MKTIICDEKLCSFKKTSVIRFCVKKTTKVALLFFTLNVVARFVYVKQKYFGKRLPW